jgi:hypothetical protein
LISSLVNVFSFARTTAAISFNLCPLISAGLKVGSVVGVGAMVGVAVTVICSACVSCVQAVSSRTSSAAAWSFPQCVFASFVRDGIAFILFSLHAVLVAFVF